MLLYKKSKFINIKITNIICFFAVNARSNTTFFKPDVPKCPLKIFYLYNANYFIPLPISDVPDTK